MPGVVSDVARRSNVVRDVLARESQTNLPFFSHLQAERKALQQIVTFTARLTMRLLSNV
jgi:hypothetical protein